MEKKNATKPKNQREKERKEEEKKEKRKEKKTTVLERAKGLTIGPSMCVYLQKCHHNFVSIT